ncbi:hypothetical protein EGK75_13195 [Neisseria weixii]|uniref:ESPR domain-containing protein n=1 Tax=Neisseria weixii TaxID=1853276 RepID=A0A3N4MIB1_9NEIS|nr:ESPR domain-containing protein [Neisseria weixii]RPD83251.1 hypothetical protein EGK74_12990 [Neisseria weixii]RPD83425.1 hypothetical protein EGK75_13195 [Neisseria weixii]
MNKTLYKVIFNKKRGCMMVVAENTTHEGKSAADTTAQSVEVAMGSVHSAFSVLSFSVSLILGAASILVAPLTFAEVSLPIKPPLKPNNPPFCKQATVHRKSTFKPLLRRGFLSISTSSLMSITKGQF